jgi:hypothetical protein
MFEEILNITRRLYLNSNQYKYLLIPKIGRQWIDDPTQVKVTLARDGTRKVLMIEGAD